MATVPSPIDQTLILRALADRLAAENTLIEREGVRAERQYTPIEQARTAAALDAMAAMAGAHAVAGTHAVTGAHAVTGIHAGGTDATDARAGIRHPADPGLPATRAQVLPRHAPGSIDLRAPMAAVPSQAQAQGMATGSSREAVAGLPGEKTQKSAFVRHRLPVLGALSAVLLTAAMAMGIATSRDRAALAGQTLAASAAQMHTQRLARALDAAIAGRAQAFDPLAQSRLHLEAATRALQAGGSIDGEPIPAVTASPQTGLAQLRTQWREYDALPRIVLERREALIAFAEQAAELQTISNQLGTLGEKLVRQTVVPPGVTPRPEMIAARLFSGSVSELRADVAQLSMPGLLDAAGVPSIETGLDQLTRQLGQVRDGNTSTGTPPLRDPAAVVVLNDIRTTIDTMLDTAQTTTPLLVAVREVRQAARGATERSDALQRGFGNLQSGLLAARAERSWLRWLATGLAMTGVALLLVLGALLTFSNRRRALEAEQQRHDAEALREHASQVNEQNQTAILRLMNELQEVADGDLTIQATVTDDITGAIADSINYTVEELRDLVGRINDTTDLVTAATNRAQLTATGLLAASEQQSREIRDTGESVLGMAAQIKLVSSSASESAQVARASLEASDRGRLAVQNSISGMNTIRDHIQETAKRIKRLGESSQEIGEIVELIGDLTEQTKLLSLNAAIQAASAGEAGRGFSVVAEEVQQLAERSMRATGQIASLIKTIQADTQDAIIAMERSTQGVVLGKHLSDEAGAALAGIGNVSRELAELILGIARTTGDQADSAENVARSIQQLLLFTERTGEGTRQNAGSIAKVSELATELKSSVARFKVSA